MSFREVEGDLFEQHLPALAHGVNCQGVMGAGIALAFARRWPALKAFYQGHCAAVGLSPGDVLTWTDPVSGTRIYNLATQEWPGADARLDAIREATAAMLTDAESERVSAVGVPQLGAGIGGLRWHDVRQVLEECAAKSAVTLVAVSLPAATPPGTP